MLARRILLLITCVTMTTGCFWRGRHHDEPRREASAHHHDRDGDHRR
jgi:hypothetical protein